MSSDKLFQKKKERQEKEFARRESLRTGNLIRIVCEGEKTEVNYLKGFQKSKRLSNIEILSCPDGSDPINIVEYAINFGEEHPEIDEIFCVFDHDGREKECQKAIEKVKRHEPMNNKNQRFKVILSVPCFELWLLLHFSDSSKQLTQKQALKELKKYYPKYEKSLQSLFTDLEPFLNKAVKNAKKLKAENKKTRSTNPSTDMHELMQALLDLTA